jgi:hypothetical protein
MLLTLLLLACSSDSMMGDEALRQIDDMRTLVADHHQAVEAAGSLDEVTPMEAAHTEEMGSMMSDMHDMMGSMMGCDMGEMMSGSMTDADDHMSEMMDSASTHEADHGDHAALSDCLDDEDRYFPNDKFQILPEQGYTAIFANILDHKLIRLHTATSFDPTMLRGHAAAFLSVPIDEYFDSRFGELPYRSIRFGHRSVARYPAVTWGVSPEQAAPIHGLVPDPADVSDPTKAQAWRDALAYMGLSAGMRIEDIRVDRVFIGSCTNSRIEDLRAAAAVLTGRKALVPGLVSPGSAGVKRQAEAEGLDAIFLAAGLEWGGPGCSMCVGMNGDLVGPGERCASTTNRNFKGRQGKDARTHLMSPAMAAAAAVRGHLCDVRDLMAEAHK